MTDYYRTQKKYRFWLDSYICQKCGKMATQTAHRIANTKTNIKKYGNEFINHNINLVSVCCLECNDSYNIGNKPLQADRLYNLYCEDRDKFYTTQEINEKIKG